MLHEAFFYYKAIWKIVQTRVLSTLCKHSFIQEVRLWKRQWSADDNKPTSLQSTFQNKDCDPNFFPNIHRILCQMLLRPVTSAGVERANLYIKNVYCSTMTEDRLNALILLFIHRDIKLDYDAIVDMYGNRHPTECCLSTLYHSEIFYYYHNLSK